MEMMDAKRLFVETNILIFATNITVLPLEKILNEDKLEEAS